MSPRPKKFQPHINSQEAIKNTAWELIAVSGASSLSLRAIARALGITAPAIYNYYPDRDALITALIADAFTSLGESQKATLDDLPAGDHSSRLAALGEAYRTWATAYPQRYQLIFGTPLPGYHAPQDITLPAGAWALNPLIATLQDAFSAGSLRTDRSAPCSAALAAMLASWSQFTGGVADEVLYVALVIWSRVHGLVSLEIGSQMPSFITSPGEVFSREIENIKIQYLY